MANLLVADAETALEPQAWRIEFEEGSVHLDGAETIEVTEPRNVTAVLISLSLSLALEQTNPHDGTLTVIWIPPSVDRASAIEREADEWMRGAGDKRKDVAARADVRTLRAVWGDGRVVIYASQRDIRPALDAIVRFTLAQKEALALQADVESAWASLEADADLTHAVTWRDQRRQRHVNEMTVAAARRKMAWLRVSRSIEQLDPGLSEASKRLFAELSASATLFDHLEMLEDSVEYAVDQYELANARLTEADQARKELMHSIIGYVAIIALLVAQLLLMLGQEGLLFK